MVSFHFTLWMVTKVFSWISLRHGSSTIFSPGSLSQVYRPPQFLVIILLMPTFTSPQVGTLTSTKQ